MKSIEAELNARGLPEVPRDTIDRGDARWKTCAELRAVSTTRLRGGRGISAAPGVVLAARAVLLGFTVH